MTIQAQSADGMLHEFPDGTPDDVIDRVMKDYAQTQGKEPTSLLGAAGLSLTDQLPAMIERGTAGAMGAAGIGGPQKQELLNRAATNEADYQKNMVQDPSAPQTAADAVSGSTGPLDAAKRLGSYALHGVAANAGPLAANVGASLIMPESIIGRMALAGGDYLMNLGGAMQDKGAHGADGDNASLGDIANAAAQTALMRAPNLGAGAGLMARAAGGVVSNAAKGVGQSVLSDAGAAAQGGNFGSDPALQIASNALDAGVLGGTMGAGGEALHAAGQVPANLNMARKAGGNVRAFSDETSDWNAAVQKAQDGIKAQDPNVSPDDLRSQAYQAAAAAGVEPPTFDKLSPKAQNGAAELSALQMYQQRLQVETAGMGKDSTPEPSTVFKGVMRDVDRNLRDTGQGLVGAGLIDKDQLSDFTAAITEAQRHNHNAGEGGSSVGYFDTLRDKVADWQIDPAIKNTLLMQLRVLDVSSQNSMKQNAKGFLETHSGIILGSVGAGAAAMTGLAAPATGAIGGYLARAGGTSILRSLDKTMGNQLPPLLRNQQAIQDYASKNGLQPGTTPGDLMAVAKQMQDLKGQQPIGPQMAAQQAAQQAAMASRNAGPVTADPTGYANGIRPGDPNATPITPQVIPGRPQTAPGVPPGLVANPAAALAPRPPVVAPPARAPVVPAQAIKGRSAPPLPGDALKAIQGSLAARAGALGQAAKEAFPSEPGGGWSRAIASTLGVPHSEVRRVISEAELPPDLRNMLEQDHPIPRQVMTALTDHLADLRDRGMVSRHPDAPQGGHGGSVQDAMRLASYQASIRQAEASANAVRASHPELAPVVARIEAESKTSDKGEVLDSYLRTVKDPGVRASTEALLRPLTAFGDKRMPIVPGNLKQ